MTLIPKLLMTFMWTKLARLHLLLRCSIKSAIFFVVLLVTLYPHPILFCKQVRHLENVESLIQPGLPALAQINREIDRQLPPHASPKAVYKAVERYVYEHIPFEYDWDNWGNVDYWPTAAEVLKRGREDCDGRAVLAASILRSRGFASARVEGNITHIWVALDDGELMGPEQDKNLRREGGHTVLSLPSLGTVLDGVAMIHEFPAVRSIIILLTALLLCFHPCRSGAGFGAVAAAGVAGFGLLMRWGGLHLDGHVKGVDAGLVAAMGLLVGAFLLAVLMPRLLNRPVNPVACGLALPDGEA